MFLRRAASNLIHQRFRFPFSQAPRISLSNTETISYERASKGHNGSFSHTHSGLWLILSSSAAMFLGINTSPLLAKEVSKEENFENDIEEDDIFDFRKVEEDSYISNEHTRNWRIFTDRARGLSRQGNLKEAEEVLLSALQEAIEGFGERDPHVASSYNNLAELYRVNKAYDKAEPLYLEAINLLEEAFGPDDVRVGAALHNLGQFYLVQRNLEEACKCYKRALKLKGRILGLNHAYYADTMYHLGMVMYLQGKEEESEALILDSINILEEGDEAEFMTCAKRMRFLAQIYLKTNRLGDAENIQRKILHKMELMKGWDTIDTVVAAEGLALILQSAGNLEEAQHLLEKCLNTCIALRPNDHIQIGASKLFLARLAMLKANELRKLDDVKAIAELDKAKSLLHDIVRITQKFLDKLTSQISKMQNYGASKEAKMNGRKALAILLQSFDAIGHLEITKRELQEAKESYDHSPVVEAENALLRCLSAYRKYGTGNSIFEAREVKEAYVSCMKYLVSLISDKANNRMKLSKGLDLRAMKEEIERLEAEVSTQETELDR